jgi:hypothetical protein
MSIVRVIPSLPAVEDVFKRCVSAATSRIKAVILVLKEHLYSDRFVPKESLNNWRGIIRWEGR